MLKKFQSVKTHFEVGCSIYLVTRNGEILSGYHVAKILMDLVELDRPPKNSSEKQGFTIKGNRIIPNWCEGRKTFRAGFATLGEAEQFLKSKSKNE